MKQALLILAMIYSCNSIAQKPTLLFVIESGVEDEKEIVAVPFVMYTKGKYEIPPTCEIGAIGTRAINECNKAKKIIKPLVQKGQLLYLVENGKQSGTARIIKTVEFGLSDWLSFSGALETKPLAKILTNNPALGLKTPKEITKASPTLKTRKDSEGNILSDELFEKIDIDGDGIAEFIYRCNDFEGQFYEIYSFKNNAWKKVYSGGYQGV